MGREPTFIVSTARTGGGKTRANMEMIKREITKPNPQKVLIIDGKDEYGPDEEDIRITQLYAKPIHISQVPKFSASRFIECCRIRPFNDRGEPLSLQEIRDALLIVMKYFRNGMLVIEDFKRFAGNSIKQELVDRLCTLRGTGNDVLVSMQSPGQITPIMWQNMKYLRMHKTTDSVVSYQDNYRDKIEFMIIAENMINEEFYKGNPYFYLMVDLEQGFITGKYSQKQFIEAAQNYLFENWSTTVGKMMNYRNGNGEKVHTEKTAMQECLRKFTYSYSQFSPRFPKNKR
jgi:hypothetical protein